MPSFSCTDTHNQNYSARAGVKVPSRKATRVAHIKLVLSLLRDISTSQYSLIADRKGIVSGRRVSLISQPCAVPAGQPMKPLFCENMWQHSQWLRSGRTPGSCRLAGLEGPLVRRHLLEDKRHVELAGLRQADIHLHGTRLCKGRRKVLAALILVHLQ